jgi:hypothetical protein
MLVYAKGEGHAATAHVPLAGLATLARIPLTDLRRLSPASTTTESVGPPVPGQQTPYNRSGDPTPT